MTLLSVNPLHIPDEMKSLPQWLVWRAVQRDGRVKKIPYRVDGRPGSSTNPDDWTSFGKRQIIDHLFKDVKE